MMLNPMISVVVPTYNRADLIVDTLRSLQSQQFENYEIIIVDDGSTDNTAEVVVPFLNEKTRYILKENAERAAARNFGVSLARGKYVNFFDSDDIALPGHLAEACRIIGIKDSPEWFHLGYAWADPEGKVFRKVDNFSGDTLNGIMSGGNPLSCNGVFIRKDIALQHRFNEDRELSASEDYELWCRLSARFPLYYSNTITSLVIDHESRSVRKISGTKLIRRLQLLVGYLEKDEAVQGFFGADFNEIKMDAHSYIALHLANDPIFKWESLVYLYKAAWDHPGIFRHRRFYATIKNILIKW